MATLNAGYEEDSTQGVGRQYAAALRAYFEGAGELALMAAYQLGRVAVRGGLGVVDMIQLHERALLQLEGQTPFPPGEPLPGARLLAECLSPFELTHRGFQAANAELQRANVELAAKNEQLEATARELREARDAAESANQELEAFSYSVSHDLRAPLRAIAGFGEALSEEYASRLDDVGRDYLRRVNTAAQRMAELIDDLLELSRVTRSELHRSSANLSELARDVLAELRSREPDRQVTVSVRNGLLAHADGNLMRIVLENLLGNAWKFTARTAAARIEFDAETRGESVVYRVRDNGAGFDGAYASRLFRPFQRLHTDAEFPGTGIGLATVRRIVTRHGGDIWAEGAIGEGATVFFTLRGP